MLDIDIYSRIEKFSIKVDISFWMYVSLKTVQQRFWSFCRGLVSLLYEPKPPVDYNVVITREDAALIDLP